MTQLCETKTYRTRDGSRTGIRVLKNPDFTTLWFERGQPIAGTWTEGGMLSTWRDEQAGDLIEESLMLEPRPFSYDACPMHEDGRRRAVTRDGREVVLLTDTAPGKTPIAGVVVDGNGGWLRGWDAIGSAVDAPRFADATSGLDLLVPPPPKRIVWVNLYESGIGPCAGVIASTSERAADSWHASANMGERLGNRAYPIEIDAQDSPR